MKDLVHPRLNTVAGFRPDATAEEFSIPQRFTHMQTVVDTSYTERDTTLSDCHESGCTSILKHPRVNHHTMSGAQDDNCMSGVNLQSFYTKVDAFAWNDVRPEINSGGNAARP